MSIMVTHQKEALGEAYVRAVTAQAGYSFGKPDYDYGVDGAILEVIHKNGRFAQTGFGINFQLKSSCDVSFENDQVIYDLESKNYNDFNVVNLSPGQASELKNCPCCCGSIYAPAAAHDGRNAFPV